MPRLRTAWTSSISRSARLPRFDDPVDIAFLVAADAGVFVAQSAGNEGPGPCTTAAGEPWVMTVAASTQTRHGLRAGDPVNAPAAIAGDYASLEARVHAAAGRTPAADAMTSRPRTRSTPARRAIAPDQRHRADLSAAPALSASRSRTPSTGGRAGVIVYTPAGQPEDHHGRRCDGGDTQHPGASWSTTTSGNALARPDQQRP